MPLPVGLYVGGELSNSVGAIEVVELPGLNRAEQACAESPFDILCPTAASDDDGVGMEAIAR